MIIIKLGTKLFHEFGCQYEHDENRKFGYKHKMIQINIYFIKVVSLRSCEIQIKRSNIYVVIPWSL